MGNREAIDIAGLHFSASAISIFIVVPVGLLILFAFIFAPNVTRMGRFDKKAIRFPGIFELCYLHPNRFKPDLTIFSDLCLRKGERYSII